VTVINDSNAIVAVAIVIVVVFGCPDVTVWNDQAVCAAVVVVVGFRAGAGARIAGATGNGTTYRSVIDSDKMRLNTIPGDEGNICYDAMITKHQLTRTTACTEDRRKCY